MIVQGLIASIATAGGPTPPPSFQSIDSNFSLGASWTVEIICDLFPTQFWATIWGNESWFAGQGHLAYLTSTTSLNVGSPNAQDSYTLAQDVSVKSYWVFTHSDGGGIDVYRNGVLLTPDMPGYTQPSSPASNTLLYGARHGNDGTGTTDTIGSGNYYYYDISTQAQTAGWVDASYNNLKGAYGLP